MRFYFHLRVGETISRDEIGLDLPDLETAYLEAFKGAQEMWSELLAERSDPLMRSFEISDEHGQVLLRLPFREVLERARKPTRLPNLRQSLRDELQEHRKLTASLQEKVKTARATIEVAQKTFERTRRLLRRVSPHVPQDSPSTLGDVLYAKSKPSVPEQDWAVLVQSIASRDQRALHALYERAHRPVFTLMMRITANRETAEELTIDVFHDVWRRAPAYDAANGTVLGWIMNQARSRAIDRLRFESRKKRTNGGNEQAVDEVAADPHDVLELSEQGEALRAALSVLTSGERQAIETTFFAGLTHAEAAVRLNEPLGTIKTRIRSGLHKLRQALTARAGGNMNTFPQNPCPQSEVTCAYAAQALAPDEVARAKAHIAFCSDCRRELESLRPVVERFVSWPSDVLTPTTSVQDRLALRIAEETGKELVPPPLWQWSEPEWEQVAPGIECKLLADDAEKHRVSMLVRLAPGASYPPHTHAGVEELHLLDGELWINGRRLVPGDYNYGAPGTLDKSVWSETGCTCVLVTSTEDTLR